MKKKKSVGLYDQMMYGKMKRKMNGNSVAKKKKRKK